MKKQLLALLLLSSPIAAQSVGDLIIQRVTATGSNELYVTPAPTKILGLNDSGLPSLINLGSGVTLPGGTLTINPAWSSITGAPTTLIGFGITDAQPLDADLTSIAGLNTTSFGRSLLELANGTALAALLPADESGITLYVDNVNGNDAYDGTSAAAPLATLAKAVELAGSSAVIGLKRGCVWRETLDLTALTSPTVIDYGTDGSPPEITGADIVAVWSAVGGTTHVWSASVVHEGTGSGRLRVYEDGLQLARVDDEATCDALAGSFVEVLGSGGTPATVKIHPSDSGNPNTNGSVYEVTVRHSAIVGPDNATIAGITTGRAINNNGSLDLVNTTDATIQRCLGVLGSKHNIGMGSGTMSDSIAVGADTTITAEPSNAQLVAFLDDGTGETATWTRCGIVDFAPGVDILSHGNPNPLDAVNLVQCWTVGTGGFAGAATTITGGYYEGVIGLPVQSGDLDTTIIRIVPDAAVTSPATYTNVTITDCCILMEQKVADNFNELFRPNQPHKATFTQTSMYCDTSLSTGNYSLWFANGNSDQDIELDHCVIFNGHSQMRLAAGGTYVGDYNVFIAGAPGDTNEVLFLHHTAGWCVTLGAWQTATGQDANSVWLARADQVRGNGYAFWLGVATDSNDGPADGDWRVNPDARVYGGDDTPYYGTFADGVTPITEAGAQNQRDWNARASAVGPPAAWPNVPATLDAAKSYIRAPLRWVF